MNVHVSFALNGSAMEADAHPGGTLLDVLKHQLGIVSVKRGCEIGECGACTVLLDGKPVNSCLVLASQAQGREVTTLEGLEDDVIKRLQTNFAKSNALQCGFCTPGFLVTLYALLKERPDCTEDEVKTAVEGNLCRCGAYLEITKAAVAAKAPVTR